MANDVDSDTRIKALASFLCCEADEITESYGGTSFDHGNRSYLVKPRCKIGSGLPGTKCKKGPLGSVGGL